MLRFLKLFCPGVAAGLLCTSGVGFAADGIDGLYLMVPTGFTASSTANEVELVSIESFCSIRWRETLTSTRPGEASTEAAQGTEGASDKAITRNSYRASEVDYITWQREIKGPATRVVGTGTCPSWSADGMEDSMRTALQQAVLARTATEEAFAGLPFITAVPEGFVTKRRFANSIVLGGKSNSWVEHASITLSSLQVRQRELPFEDLATTLLANQTSLTDVVVTSQQNVAVNGLLGHHLLAAGNVRKLPSRIHQVLIGNADALVLITLTVPSDSSLAEAEAGANLPAENQLLANLMTSLRLR